MHLKVEKRICGDSLWSGSDTVANGIIFSILELSQSHFWTRSSGSGSAVKLAVNCPRSRILTPVRQPMFWVPATNKKKGKMKWRLLRNNTPVHMAFFWSRFFNCRRRCMNSLRIPRTWH